MLRPAVLDSADPHGRDQRPTVDRCPAPLPPRWRNIPSCDSPLVDFPDHTSDPVSGFNRNQRPALSNKGVESPHNVGPVVQPA